MATTDTDKEQSRYITRLYPEDQARVDKFVTTGINSVKRKPFRPGRLLVMLIFIVFGLSLFSQLMARWAGVS